MRSMAIYGLETKIAYLFVQKEMSSVEAETNRSLSPQKKKKIINRLDECSAILDLLKMDESEEIQHQLISLYGKVHALSIEYELEQMRECNDELEITLAANDIEKGKPLLNQLKKHLSRLERLQALSREEQALVNRAAALVQKSLFQFYGEESAKRELLKMEQKASVRRSMKTTPEIDLDAIADLFEVAALIYSGNETSGRESFEKLPDQQKNLTRKHLFVLQEGNDLPFVTPLTTIQALVATANDFAGGKSAGSYISQEQVEQMFQDLKEISKDD